MLMAILLSHQFLFFLFCVSEIGSYLCSSSENWEVTNFLLYGWVLRVNAPLPSLSTNMLFLFGKTKIKGIQIILLCYKTTHFPHTKPFTSVWASGHLFSLYKDIRGSPLPTTKCKADLEKQLSEYISLGGLRGIVFNWIGDIQGITFNTPFMSFDAQMPPEYLPEPLQPGYWNI